MSNLQTALDKLCKELLSLLNRHDYNYLLTNTTFDPQFTLGKSSGFLAENNYSVNALRAVYKLAQAVKDAKILAEGPQISIFSLISHWGLTKLKPVAHYLDKRMNAEGKEENTWVPRIVDKLTYELALILRRFLERACKEESHLLLNEFKKKLSLLNKRIDQYEARYHSQTQAKRQILLDARNREIRTIQEQKNEFLDTVSAELDEIEDAATKLYELLEKNNASLSEGEDEIAQSLTALTERFTAVEADIDEIDEQFADHQESLANPTAMLSPKNAYIYAGDLGVTGVDEAFARGEIDWDEFCPLVPLTSPLPEGYSHLEQVGRSVEEELEIAREEIKAYANSECFRRRKTQLSNLRTAVITRQQQHLATVNLQQQKEGPLTSLPTQSFDHYHQLWKETTAIQENHIFWQQTKLNIEKRNYHLLDVERLTTTLRLDKKDEKIWQAQQVAGTASLEEKIRDSVSKKTFFKLCPNFVTNMFVKLLCWWEESTINKASIRLLEQINTYVASKHEQEQRQLFEANNQLNNLEEQLCPQIEPAEQLFLSNLANWETETFSWKDRYFYFCSRPNSCQGEYGLDAQISYLRTAYDNLTDGDSAGIQEFKRLAAIFIETADEVLQPESQAELPEYISTALHKLRDSAKNFMRVFAFTEMFGKRQSQAFKKLGDAMVHKDTASSPLGDPFCYEQVVAHKHTFAERRRHDQAPIAAAAVPTKGTPSDQETEARSTVFFHHPHV